MFEPLYKKCAPLWNSTPTLAVIYNGHRNAWRQWNFSGSRSTSTRLNKALLDYSPSTNERILNLENTYTEEEVIFIDKVVVDPFQDFSVGSSFLLLIISLYIIYFVKLIVIVS